MQKGDQGKFFKKVALAEKAWKHSGANGIKRQLVVTYSAKNTKDFGAKLAIFSEKVQRRDQEKFFKHHQKVALVWKAQKDTGANGIIL